MPPRKRATKRTTTRKRAATKKTAAKPAPQRIPVPAGQRLFILNVPFEERAIGSANGARWDPALRQSVYIGTVLPRGLEPYAPEWYSWEHYMQDELNGAVTHPPKKAATMKPRPHQMEAAKKISDSNTRGYRGFLEADDVGLGKAQPLDSLVLTPTGFKRMGDMRVGDAVIDAATGSMTWVQGVYPQGVRPVYKVRFSDGTVVKADGEHLWLVSRGPGRFDPARPNLVSTVDLKTRLGKEQPYEWFIPMISPPELVAGPEGVSDIWCSSERRRAAVEELLGSAGQVSEDVWEFPSSRVESLVWLVQSLGGTASPVQQTGSGLVRVRVSLSRAGSVPFRRVEAIEEAGEEPTQCISLTSESKLYATDGFVVTHNTLASYVGALRVLKQRQGKKLLVMCPKGVVAHWRRSIAAMGDYGNRIVVINYDQAKKLVTVPDSALDAKKTRTRNKRIADQGQPVVDWDVIIFDESHLMKNSLAQRTKIASRIARYSAAATKAPFVVWMSATAGQNPPELAYLVPLFAQLTGAKHSELRDFGKWLESQGYAVTFNERFSKWEWGVVPDEASPREIAAIEAAKQADLKRIHRLLFAAKDAPSIRRSPTDVAGWPAVQRFLYPVYLDASQQRDYEKAWELFRHEMGLAAKGTDPRRNSFAARLRFRQKASLIRVPGTADKVLELLENGHQVAVSVEFLESLDMIRELVSKAGYECAEFSGRNSKDRESERFRFQTGAAQVMLFTVKEGVSLHQGEDFGDGRKATNVPRTMLVHDPRYSGLDALQIEGRTHRDGKNSNIYYMYAADTVEEQVVGRLLERLKSTKSMQGDDVSGVTALESLLNRAAGFPSA